MGEGVYVDDYVCVIWLQTNKQTSINDLLEKDGGTKNCIYKD